MTPPKFDSFAKGQELATKAEHQPLAAINKELAEQKRLHPNEFSAIIKSMQGANIVHLAADKQRVEAELKSRTIFDKFMGKPEPSLIVPELTLEGEDPKNRLKNPTHVAVAMLPDLRITQGVGDTIPAPQKSAQAPTTRSSFETGNYSNTAQGQEDAFNDVLNPARHNKKVP